jgi:hypothetical protein
MKVSGLRRERDKGRLVIERIANKEFTTLRAINEMRERCRDTQRGLGSGLNPKKETGRDGSSGAPHGSLETDRVRSALDALKQTARGLSKPSANTSQENTKSREIADVILLKS